MNEGFDERRYLIPFRSALLPQIFTDVLVIGAGVAGLRATIAAATKADVIVALKGGTDQSNTYFAQGGIAAVLSRPSQPDRDTAVPVDSIDAHVADTVGAGAGLCDEQAVRSIVTAGNRCISDLMRAEMRFDTASHPGGPGTSRGSSALALGQEGGHAVPRILHADGDATGRALIDSLLAQVRRNDRVRLFDHCFVLDLITVDGPSTTTPGRCVGAITHHPRYGLQVIWAGSTILSTGGCGQVFRESTNPAVATGDGIAMAYRAGAMLADMAFVQFHPTTLYVAGAPRYLISEAVRGEGAHLIDGAGHRFMPGYDARADLAPRDIVSRSILAQLAKTASTHVYLDCRHIPADRFTTRFPGISASLRKFGINPASDPIPVRPSAHYMIGGVDTDLAGRTNVRGLYACGEVASTGMHGANRLASNSLLEGLVVGEMAGQASIETLEHPDASDQDDARTPTSASSTAATRHTRGPAKIVSDIRPSDRSELDLNDVRSSLRSIMWRHVGIQRTGDRLAEVVDMFDFWARYTLDKIFDDQDGWEVQNMLLAGALITRAALWRRESRGTHFRQDHPATDDAYRVHDLWTRGITEPEVRPVAADPSEPLDSTTVVITPALPRSVPGSRSS